MDRITIGTFGYCGSGQDTLADDLCTEMGFLKFSLGDFIREIATKMGKSHSRESLQNVRLYLDKVYGRNYVSEEVLRRIQKTKSKKIIFTGIRRMEEYHLFRKELGMKLIYIYADENLRYQRMLHRAEEKDAGTIETLQRQMARETHIFDYSELKKVADYQFDFNITLNEYNIRKSEILKTIICAIYS